MLILALDTTMAGCSLALVGGRADQPETLFSQQMAMRHGQAESLLPAIASALDQIDKTPQDITVVAATTGPGAFTGIRVGLAAARGFALSLGCPGIGVDGFTLYRAMATEAGHPPAADGHLIAIDSRRAEHYLSASLGDQVVDHSLALTDIEPWLDRVGTPKAGWVITGDLADAVAQNLTRHSARLVAQQLPDPVILARLAIDRLDDPKSHPLNPVYHRPPDATPAKPTRIWLADQD